MKTMKNLLFSLALLLSGAIPVLAQHEHGTGDHKHASTHGGTVKSAGNYHFELLQKPGMLTVYLLDANQKTLPVAGSTATALLQTPDGKVTTTKLTPTGTEQFVATLDQTKPVHKAIVTVLVNGKSVSATFDLEEAKHADGQAAHKH